MAILGFEALNISLVLTVYSAVVYVLGRVRKSDKLLNSAQRAVHAWIVLISLATLALMYSLFARDFQIEYVASYSNRALSWFYTAAALWGGQAGSLLFWAFLLAMFTLIVYLQLRKNDPERLPIVMIVMSLATLFFVFLLVFKSNPFHRLPFVPEDGRGLNPLLQNPAMVFHPPSLYLGFVSTTVPFALAIAALFTRKLDAHWLRAIRNWTLFSWLFLTIGNVLGMQWAYVELGWGGYWAWDPVENSSLLPWLTSTALVHSLMVQEFRDQLKAWNIILIMLTFALTIFGTFVTRSGLISSVHAFGVSDLGPLFLGYLAIIIVSTLFILGSRMSIMKSQESIESWTSRESTFLLNNMLFVALTVGVLVGTIYPSVSEAINGQQQTVGADFFNRMATPFGLVIFFLIGLGTLLSWRKTGAKDVVNRIMWPVIIAIVGSIVLYVAGIRSFMPLLSFWIAIFSFVAIFADYFSHARQYAKREGVSVLVAAGRIVVKNKRRYGAYIVHIGVLMMFLGFIGSAAFGQEKTETLNREDSINIGAYTVRYKGLETSMDKNVQVYSARFDVYKGAEFLTQLRSDKHKHPNFQPSTEVGIRSTLENDIYVVLAGFQNSGEQATVTVYLNPLMLWMWLGGIFMTIGTLMAFTWNTKKKQD